MRCFLTIFEWKRDRVSEVVFQHGGIEGEGRVVLPLIFLTITFKRLLNVKIRNISLFLILVIIILLEFVSECAIWGGCMCSFRGGGYRIYTDAYKSATEKHVFFCKLAKLTPLLVFICWVCAYVCNVKGGTADSSGGARIKYAQIPIKYMFSFAF